MRCSTSKVPQLVQLYSYVGMQESVTTLRRASRVRATAGNAADFFSYPFSTMRMGNLLSAEQTMPEGPPIRS
jgi:hypothetical protein